MGGMPLTIMFLCIQTPGLLLLRFGVGIYNRSIRENE
jgi:hypothetical protein